LRSCDICPGGSECAAVNLTPVLSEIHALYQAGTTDKFEILFALSGEAEELFERYNDQVSRICWTRAALEIIAGVLSSSCVRETNKDVFDEDVRKSLRTAVNAYAEFPWYVSGLIGQAGDLYDAVNYLDESDQFAVQISKREFVKICKKVVYDNVEN
jgi:hypothetical protein